MTLRILLSLLLLLPTLALGKARKVDDYQWEGVERVVAIGDIGRSTDGAVLIPVTVSDLDLEEVSCSFGLDRDDGGAGYNFRFTVSAPSTPCRALARTSVRVTTTDGNPVAVRWSARRWWLALSSQYPPSSSPAHGPSSIFAMRC